MIGGEWSPLLDDNVKARIVSTSMRVEYSGGEFDDMTVAAYAGPQGSSELGVSASSAPEQDVRLGTRTMSAARAASWPRITASHRTGWWARDTGRPGVTDNFIPEQSGPLWSAQTQAVPSVLSPSSLFQLQLGFNRQEAQIAPYCLFGCVVAAAAIAKIFTLGGFPRAFGPSCFITRYDAALAAFGKTRSDDAVSLAFTLLNRRFDYHGLAPRFSLHLPSSTATFRSTALPRNQLQIGLTSLF